MRATDDRIHLPFGYFLVIARRDKWTCHWCEIGYLPNDPWEIDHVVPLSAGGTNHLTNLSLAHRSCNADKGALCA